MHSTEVIVSEVQSERRVMVGPPLAKSVRQSGKSAVLHSHAQVATLDDRRANPIPVRSSEHAFLFRSDTFRWTIARLVLRVVLVDFD